MILENFDQLLSKYAQLIINKGIAVKEGDHVQINGQIEQADLVRLLTQHAYEAGAKQVFINWADTQTSKLHYQGQDIETLTEIPQYEIDRADSLLAKKAKRISISGADPNGLAGVDGEKLAAAQQANAKAFNHISIATQANEVSWCVCSAATPAWAALVFPDLGSSEDQVTALWDQIFKTTRVYEADPIQAWDDHEANLNDKANFLNEQQFDYLEYSAPGTQFKLGLPKNHIWESAGSYNRDREKFIANMPTEEVFTAPDFRRAQGTVSSTKPLSYAGNIIEGMQFSFEDGQVVEVKAERGEETLKKLLENNRGARSLGEVALVAHKSPISQSGITFYNTLFDENASNHLALGQAYASSVEGGTDMSQEELEAAGLNRSDVHVDFMIGSDKMDIDGIKADGSRIPIFRQGEWAF